jgi:hypothetical protein
MEDNQPRDRQTDQPSPSGAPKTEVDKNAKKETWSELQIPRRTVDKLVDDTKPENGRRWNRRSFSEHIALQRRIIKNTAGEKTPQRDSPDIA